MRGSPLEIVFASGKGGTGKTFLSSNFLYYLGPEEAIGIDADVEAPDLLLALGGEKRRLFEQEVWESWKAKICEEKCLGGECLKCLEVCRFFAIEAEEGVPRIIEENCEGCGACSIVCPKGAISLYKKRTGVIYASLTPRGECVLSGDLEIGGRNTGHLVEILKDLGKERASELGVPHVIVDAAAGIGCAVISSLVGADVLVVVAEPTPQSLQGASRIIEVSRGMNVKKRFLVFNKAEREEEDLGIEVLGEIPYDPKVFLAYSEMRPILEMFPNSKASKALKEIFEKLEGEMG